MPSVSQSYDVLINFVNDTSDCVSIQLLRDYGREDGAFTIIQPSDSVTLVLESGSLYQYCLKTRINVASVIVRPWRDIHCNVSILFIDGTSRTTEYPSSVNGIIVDRLWRDYRFGIWDNP
ncbi:hypothetical protein EDD18DRAFT_1342481 [Armillaria luteobubalina]|uniref:Uncharacterized protein n=1 Tax=Armillaria luteobubalina TaxID=153913 RepID=A0AA39V0M2_9AGAR|nr:hypothetical protein F5146DRAFT_1019465 [Armillaria mellea]KAK0233160.1 hypothetical protein IW262DRAFT_1258329 [Armillaria fumosa]KAK0506159.1 hypothetical protein EDD18DRAFT_1342481 [Armillaria luteobubalina]